MDVEIIKICLSYVIHVRDEAELRLTKSKTNQLISILEQCVEMAPSLLDTNMKIFLYGTLGDLYQSVPQAAKAINCYEYVLSLISISGNHVAEMEATQQLGNTYQLLEQYHKTIEYYERTLSIAKEIGNKSEEENAYCRLGSAHDSLGEYQIAIEHHKKGLEVAKEIGDRWGEGNTYCHLGIIYNSLGEYQKAIEYYVKSLSIAKEIDDKRLDGKGYGNLGRTYLSLGQYHKAIECEEKSLSISKEIGDIEQEAAAYVNLGIAYRALGEYHKAIGYYEKGVSIAKEIGNIRGEGIAYLALGNTYITLGEYHKAIEYFKKSLQIDKEINNINGEGHNYASLATVYESLGKYHDAIEYSEKSLRIAKEIGHRAMEGNAYQILGNAFICLGEYHKAREYYEKSLSITKAIGNKHGEGTAYRSCGSAYSYLGDYRKAIEYYDKGLCIAKEIGDRGGEGSTYVSLGNANCSLGDSVKAIEYYEKGLSICKEINARYGEGNAYVNLGIAYRSSGEYHKAISYYEKSLSIAKEIGDRYGEAETYHNIGFLYQDERSTVKDLTKSKHYLKRSTQCYEKLFDDLKEKDQFKVSIVDVFIRTYKLLSRVHINTGQNEEALLVCERGRARALKDLLSLKYNTAKETESKELELADIKAVSSHHEACVLFYNLDVIKLTYHCWIISSRGPTFFYNEMNNRDALAAIESSLSEAEGTNIKTGYFQYLVDNSFQELHVREGKGMKCEDRSIELLDLEDRESALSANSSKHSETDLTIFRRIDRCIPDEEDDVQPLDLLFYRLVYPVLQQLTHEEVIIIPDGNLFMVPFAALQDPTTGKYLSETKRIRLAPSLTTLKILHESSHDHHVESGALIIGNPETGKVMYRGRQLMVSDLPGAEEEAVEIGNLLGVQPLIGKQATKELILEKLKQGVSVIHFAAHGSEKNGQIFLAPSKPTTNSTPATEQDCVLTMKEAQESGIRAQLVVLSCCHSGKGDIRSEGVVGMARAFLAAGARAVVASLWAIDDTATKFFMLKFYSHLKKGESASKSLQQAMNEVREMGYREPMYWAGFFLIGDDVTITV